MEENRLEVYLTGCPAAIILNGETKDIREIKAKQQKYEKRSNNWNIAGLLLLVPTLPSFIPIYLIMTLSIS